MAQFMYFKEVPPPLPPSSGSPKPHVWGSAVFHEIHQQNKDNWLCFWPTLLMNKAKEEGCPTTEMLPNIHHCNLCKESVKQNGNFKSGRFGILENCSHVFCLNCIRFHRLQYQKKSFPPRPDRNCDQYPVLPFSCPVCNAQSSCIASSYMHFGDSPLKNLYVEHFKAEMEFVPCQWIKIGQGACAYPNDCCGRPDLGKMQDRLLGSIYTRSKKENESQAPPRWQFIIPSTQF